MGKQRSDKVEDAAAETGAYVEFAPGQYLFTQEWEQQSFDCQSRLLKEGKPSDRRMLASARYSPSQVNGATPTPDDSGKVWPHLILVELR